MLFLLENHPWLDAKNRPRIEMTRELNRCNVPEFNSSRKEHHWRRRKLKRNLSPLRRSDSMTHIQTRNQVVTQITVIEAEPEKQNEALSLVVERARFMAKQPGFVSISLHRSLDGRRIVNYVQWQSRELLQSAHHSPEFRAEWRHFDELTRDIEPQLYDVALVMDGERVAAARKQTRTSDSRKAHPRRTATRAAAARKAARARPH